MKKGVKPQVAVQPEKAMMKETKKMGPAEAKLKSMMKREPIIDVSVSKPSFKKKEVQIREDHDDIGE